MTASPRDVHLKCWYYKQASELPLQDVESKFGKFKDVFMSGNFQDGGDSYATYRQKYFEKKPAVIVDGRTHLPGGKEAWKFEEHGFCYLTPPPYEFEDHTVWDRKKTDKEYAPAAVEAVRKAVGAKKVFFMSHQRRAEMGVAKFAEMHAVGGGHSDYGPEFEPQFRTVLTTRYGVPEQEAQTAGICIVNMWQPVQRPAFKHPLAVLDCSSVDIEKECIRYKLHPSVDNGYGYLEEMKGGTSHPRPLEERVPQAAQDAPALSPCWGPNHRWVYLSDMREDEAVIFKQIDFRKSAPAKATFHMSFDDRFHNDWKECPDRRSIESRFILVFDPEETAVSSKL